MILWNASHENPAISVIATNLLELTNSVIKCLNFQHQEHVMCMDFSKDFDTINDITLLFKPSIPLSRIIRFASYLPTYSLPCLFFWLHILFLFSTHQVHHKILFWVHFYFYSSSTTFPLSISCVYPHDLSVVSCRLDAPLVEPRDPD